MPCRDPSIDTVYISLCWASTRTLRHASQRLRVCTWNKGQGAWPTLWSFGIACTCLPEDCGQSETRAKSWSEAMKVWQTVCPNRLCLWLPSRLLLHSQHCMYYFLALFRPKKQALLRSAAEKRWLQEAVSSKQRSSNSLLFCWHNRWMRSWQLPLHWPSRQHLQQFPKRPLLSFMSMEQSWSHFWICFWIFSSVSAHTFAGTIKAWRTSTFGRVLCTRRSAHYYIILYRKYIQLEWPDLATA